METIITNKFKRSVRGDSFTSTLGMIIVLSSIAMLFIALLSAYGILRVRSDIWMSGSIKSYPLTLSWINTVVILLSSFTFNKASKLFESNNNKKSLNFISFTIILGICFLILQTQLWLVLTNDGYSITSHQAGAVFYMLSGLHGLHIIIGIFLLIWLNFYIRKYDDYFKQMKLTGMFWHFLTIIWLVIFISVIIF
ncbi:MAG: heme-copper oxidase subunit III [Candidatus Marinimicrobia bacterium]|nr:heme-copper oxidase subunit III [Candidatus Neomarinimicrobiota bacterium]